MHKQFQKDMDVVLEHMDACNISCRKLPDAYAGIMDELEDLYQKVVKPSQRDTAKALAQLANIAAIAAQASQELYREMRHDYPPRLSA